jgi:nucleolar protein 4
VEHTSLIVCRFRCQTTVALPCRLNLQAEHIQTFFGEIFGSLKIHWIFLETPIHRESDTMAPLPKRRRSSAGEEDLAAETPTTTDTSNSMQRKTLFVRSLAFTTTSESLTAHFSDLYPIKHAAVVLDPATKKSKGFGFVTFADPEDAARAKDEAQGTLVDGRKIKVDLAEPRDREKKQKRRMGAENGEDGEERAVKKKKISLGAVQEAKDQRERAKTENKSPRLIIRNLPWSIKNEEDLALLFRSYGKVKQAVVPKKNGKLAGFGFVVMRGKKNAERAMAAVNGKEIDGRTVAVDYSVDKEVWQGRDEGDESGKENDDVDEDVEDGEEASGDVMIGDGGEEDDPLGQIEWDSDPYSDADVTDEYENPDDQDVDMDDAFNDTEGEDDFDEVAAPEPRKQENTTLFLRNLPFTVTDESLSAHFSKFGPVRYARIVMDHATDRPRGTGFVAFYNLEDADMCLKNAPRIVAAAPFGGNQKGQAAPNVKHSVLQNDASDPTGNYSMDGRVLQVSRAVDRSEASKLTEQSSTVRDKANKDKRRLYLLSEGSIPSNSPLYNTLSPSEVKMREASIKQRKSLLEANPSLHLSLTRLSIRNIPRSIDSKILKALAREAAVGFASDVKAGKRAQLSKEEEARGGDEMRELERARKAKGKGIVKQAKIVFEGREGSKVPEKSGGGRSRGYGFIEYSSHRWALMGLRWLNGHAVLAGEATEAKKSKKAPSKQATIEEAQDRKKRLIVEFAIENAQVVQRRAELEERARERSKAVLEKRAAGELEAKKKRELTKDQLMKKTRKGMKRKNEEGRRMEEALRVANKDKLTDAEKLAKRGQIIGRKRMLRRKGSS